MRLPRQQARRGIAALELALLAPFLVFLFVVSIDYGRIFFASVTITNCARAGAIYASDPFAQRESPYTTIEQAALAEAPSYTPAPTVTSSSGTDANGNPYTAVTVTGQFTTITRYPGVPATTTLARTVRVRKTPDAPD